MTVEEFIKKWQEENPLEKAAKKLFEGALCGEFYIGENRKVRFSRGNLQFNAQEGTHATADSSYVQGTWRFAENQYDYIGELNGKISAGYKGWVDLFGWGTSGWNSGAKAYQPWATSDESESYYPGNNADNDLTGNFVNADWGVYNAISNGGNKPGKWRTLTTQEWQYLFSHNDWTMGKVAGTLCFLLLPEGFNAPQGITVVRLNDSSFTESQYSSNVYNAGQFKKLEELGVVALPCAGYRNGTSVCNVGSYGNFWSSSAYNSYYAYSFYFHSTGVGSSYGDFRYYGNSVRIVQDVLK